MKCSCHSQTDFIHEFEYLKYWKPVDDTTGLHVYQCRMCESYWTVSRYAKYQTTFCVRLRRFDDFKEVDWERILMSNLVYLFGGLDNKKCHYAGCYDFCVKSTIYCAKHLLETGTLEPEKNESSGIIKKIRNFF